MKTLLVFAILFFQHCQCQFQSCLQEKTTFRACMGRLVSNVPYDRITCSLINHVKSCNEALITAGCYNGLLNSADDIRRRYDGVLKLNFPANTCGLDDYSTH